MLTPEDYRQLAERCALLAFECATPGVAEELRTLALDYLTPAVSPMALDNLLSRFLQWSGLLSHLRSMNVTMSQKTLPYSIRPFCPMSADGGHSAELAVRGFINERGNPYSAASINAML